MKIKINFFIIVIILSFLIINFSKKPLDIFQTHNDESTFKYEINQGDTLWGIASSLGVENYELFIYKVKKINNIKNGLLRIDQTLLIPKNI